MHYVLIASMILLNKLMVGCVRSNSQAGWIHQTSKKVIFRKKKLTKYGFHFLQPYEI